MKKSSACPKHLLFNKIEKILEAIEEKNSDKAITLMIDLKKDGGEDESVYEHIASCMFQTLLFDRSKRNLDLLTYIFKKAEDNFFNVELCIPILGILLLLNTGTKDEVIEKVSKRMNNMAHNELQAMLNKLPEDAHNKKLIKRLKNGRCNCN